MLRICTTNSNTFFKLTFEEQIFCSLTYLFITTLHSIDRRGMVSITATNNPNVHGIHNNF